jgi:hypothetical protein
MYRLADLYGGDYTLLIDEAEKLSREAAREEREVINAGYRAGGSRPRTMPGGRVVKFPVYFPKAAALIGDVFETMRDRSICLWLRQATPLELARVKKYRRGEAEREAAVLVSDVRALVAEWETGEMPIVSPEWLSGRDEEIWMPLLSVATRAGLGKREIDLLHTLSAQLVMERSTTRKRTYEELVVDDETATTARYGAKVLADICKVLKAGEKAVFTATVIERLHAMPFSAWPAFGGTGLTPEKLAILLRPHGLAPYPVREGKGRKAEQRRGFVVEALREAAKRAGVEGE